MQKASILLALWLVLPALVGCRPPGKGPRAEAGFEQSTRIIAAINSFYTAEGSYPSSLDELVPRYLQSSDLELTFSNSSYPFTYNMVQGGFVLSFRYGGPGINDCSFNSANREWRCVGRY